MDRLQALMLEESRYLRRLIKLSRWEHDRLMLGYEWAMASMIHEKKDIMATVRRIEESRQIMHVSLQDILKHPRTKDEKNKASVIKTLISSLQRDTEQLIQMSHENNLLVHNLSLKKYQDDFGHQNKEFNSLYLNLTPANF